MTKNVELNKTFILMTDNLKRMFNMLIHHGFKIDKDTLIESFKYENFNNLFNALNSFYINDKCKNYSNLCKSFILTINTLKEDEREFIFYHYLFKKEDRLATKYSKSQLYRLKERALKSFFDIWGNEEKMVI